MCFFRVLMVGSLFLAGAAASVQAGLGRYDGDAVRDVRQTMEARKLLADEPGLEGCNIGVTVHNRVATLWGPVPSAEVAFRAELTLKTMFELTAVRNELFVSELVEPMRKPLKISIPPKYLPEMAPPKLPERSMFGAPGVLTGAKEKPAAPPALKAPAVKDANDEALTVAVGNLLAATAAFRQIQFSVKDARVYLRTTSGDADALHEAARAVARLPNVEGVVLVERELPR